MTPLELNRALLANAGIALARTTSHLDPIDRLRVWVTVDQARKVQLSYGLCASLPGTPISRHPGWQLREYDATATGWQLRGESIYFAPTDVDSLLARVRAFTS